MGDCSFIKRVNLKPASNGATNSVENQVKPNQSSSQNVSDEKTASLQVVNYASKNGTFKISSSDNFDTAVLTDSEGKKYLLKADVSASGMRLEGENGVYIHVKSSTEGDEGIVEVTRGHPIDIKEVR